MTDFYIGQKVVCIAKGDWSKAIKMHEEGGQRLAVPKAGDIYTIRDIYIDPFTGRTGLRLAEVVNDKITRWANFKLYMEIGWYEYEFRPLRKRQTDISIFRKLLSPSPIHENSRP